MSWILTPKKADIDRSNLPAVTPIAPCVGGLIVCYAKSRTLTREPAGQKEDAASPAKARAPGK